MTRNTHHRIRDHTGTDLDSNVVLSGSVGPMPSGTDLHTVIDALYDDLNGNIINRATGCEAVFDAGSAYLVSDMIVMFEMPVNATITAARLVTDQVGSIVLDLWKSSWANFPPTVSDSICGGVKPTISSGRKYEANLSSWTTSIPAGSWITVHIDSVDAIKRATLSLSLSMEFST